MYRTGDTYMHATMLLNPSHSWDGRLVIPGESREAYTADPSRALASILATVAHEHPAVRELDVRWIVGNGQVGCCPVCGALTFTSGDCRVFSSVLQQHADGTAYPALACSDRHTLRELRDALRLPIAADEAPDRTMHFAGRHVIDEARPRTADGHCACATCTSPAAAVAADRAEAR